MFFCEDIDWSPKWCLLISSVLASTNIESFLSTGHFYFKCVALKVVFIVARKGNRKMLFYNSLTPGNLSLGCQEHMIEICDFSGISAIHWYQYSHVLQPNNCPDGWFLFQPISSSTVSHCSCHQCCWINSWNIPHRLCRTKEISTHELIRCNCISCCPCLVIFW